MNPTVILMAIFDPTITAYLVLYINQKGVTITRFCYHMEGNFGGENFGKFGDSLQIHTRQLFMSSENSYWLGINSPKFISPNAI